MAKIYYNRLLTGSIKFGDIPDKYKAEVKALGIIDYRKGNIPDYQYELLFGELPPN